MLFYVPDACVLRVWQKTSLYQITLMPDMFENISLTTKGHCMDEKKMLAHRLVSEGFYLMP
jgi:hypothetical protein